MVKITMADGMIIEGFIDELAEMAKAFGGNIEVPAVEIDGVTYRKVTERKPKAGDFVKFTQVNAFNDTSLNKYYEITSVDADGDFEFIDDVGDGNVAIVADANFEVYEKVTPCCAPVGQPMPVAPLKIGDYAKVVEISSAMYGFEIGEIVKIAGLSEGRHKLSIIGKYVGYGDEGNHLVRATDEEVAEAKRKQAWAKIGRKPNEFKKGDIVRVVKVKGGIVTGHPEGVIGEVEYDTTPIDLGSGNPSLRYNGLSLMCNVELITPVEARFDRKKDALA